ncbi:MAG: hypothetical protein E3J72_03305 [Planctomycetota bacterium]|nr:MAG: hypothetical protein E3J72_03305 [Planctomycetota bacterium]
MKKFIWTLLTLIAVALGALLGVYKHQKNSGVLGKDVGFIRFLLIKRKPGTGSKEPGNKEPATTGGQKTAPVKKAVFDREAFGKLRISAKSSYREADFTAAELSYTKALELLNSAEPGDPELALKLDRMRLRSWFFARIVENMYLDNLVDGVDIVQVKLQGGRKPFFARLLEKTDYQITIERQSGITATVPISEVDLLVNLTPEQYRKTLEAILNERTRKAYGAVKQDYQSFFLCAAFAFQHKLTDRLTELLEKTFEHAESERLVNRFIPSNNLELKVALHYSFKRDTKAHVYAERLKEERSIAKKDEDKTIDKTTPGSTDPVPAGTPAPQDKLDEADELFKEGYAYYRKAIPGTTDHDINLEKAEPFLQEASEILMEIFKQQPDNKEIENNLSRIREILFDIYVRLPLKR